MLTCLMKKRLVFILIILSSGPSFFPCTAQETYLAFGDSITAGYIAGQGDTLGYTPILENLLNTAGRTAVVPNYGLGGEVTADGLQRLVEIFETETADYCLIMEGTNDISQFFSADWIAANLTAMVGVARQNGATPILATVIPRLPQDPYDPFNVWTDALNARIRIIARELDVSLCDQSENFYHHPDYPITVYSDPLHPNQAGYELMAEGWLVTILYGLPYVSVGDIDGSGKVDGMDLIDLALCFGSIAVSDHYDPAADLNLDGRIDGDDLALLASNFGWIR
jgi:lysophospholipase L1-like esterase